MQQSNSSEENVEDSNRIPDKDIPHHLQAWERTILVQQHFNDLQLKIRTIAITVIGAVLTVTAVSLKEGAVIDLWGFEFLMAAPLPLAAAVLWGAFFVMDYYWYHDLLKGAVKQGLEIENFLSNRLETVNLTRTIGDSSPTNFRCLGELRSRGKMKWFYAIVGGVLLTMSGVLFFAPVDLSPSEKSDSPKSGSTMVNPLNQDQHVALEDKSSRYPILSLEGSIGDSLTSLSKRDV